MSWRQLLNNFTIFCFFLSCPFLSQEETILKLKKKEEESSKGVGREKKLGGGCFPFNNSDSFGKTYLPPALIYLTRDERKEQSRGKDRHQIYKQE